MTGRHDPGEPAPAAHLDPKVSRLLYDLRDAGIRDQVAAINAIAAREGAGLNPGQIAAVLWQFPAPDERRRGLCETCGDEVVEGPAGRWEHATPAGQAHSAWPRITPVGPAYIPPGGRGW